MECLTTLYHATKLLLQHYAICTIGHSTSTHLFNIKVPVSSYYPIISVTPHTIEIPYYKTFKIALKK